MHFKSHIIFIVLLACLGIGVSMVVRNVMLPPHPKLNSAEKKISATTSFYPLFFFASQITGEMADVVNITPSGAEPHDYEPTSRDIASIEESALLILNGGKLEPWGDSVQNTLKGTRTLVVVVGDTLANQKISEQGTATQDPHVWLDPLLAKQESRVIMQALAKADPSHQSVYTKNEAILEKKLDNLNEHYVRGLHSCAMNTLITSHAAFGYLASRYHLNQLSIAGLSPDAEPSPQQLASIVDFAKKNHVQTIFFENLVSPKLSETIAREMGAKTFVLNPLEGLSDDELRAGKNYFTEMESNLAHLRTALQCQ